MASSPRTAASSRIGSSKSHAALSKIIAIISTTPSPTSPPRPAPDDALGAGDPVKLPPAGGTDGSGVDLRLRLGPPPQIGGGSVEGDGGGPTEQSGVVDVVVASSAMAEEGMAAPAAVLAEPSLSPAASVAGGEVVAAAAKSSEGECDPEEEHAEESREATAKEAEGKATAYAEKKETKGIGTAQAGTSVAVADAAMVRDRGSLDLLVEAVRQVSGSLFDDDGGPAEENPERSAAAAPAPPRKRMRSAGGVKKQRVQGEQEVEEEEDEEEEEEEEEDEESEWCIPLDLYEEETAPIVRSKRGRNQALPSRYRDSILDPWRKPAALPRHGRATRP